MPTVSFHASAELVKKIEAVAKKKGGRSSFLREAAERAIERETASFGDFAKKYAGIVRSGRSDLSAREGF